MAAIIGVDPHKHVLSAVALDERGGLLARRAIRTRPRRVASVGGGARTGGHLGDRGQQQPGTTTRSDADQRRSRRA